MWKSDKSQNFDVSCAWVFFSLKKYLAELSVDMKIDSKLVFAFDNAFPLHNFIVFDFDYSFIILCKKWYVASSIGMMHQATSWNVVLAHVRYQQYIFLFVNHTKRLNDFQFELWKLKFCEKMEISSFWHENLWTLFEVNKEMKQLFSLGVKFFSQIPNLSCWEAKLWGDEFEAFI